MLSSIHSSPAPGSRQDFLSSSLRCSRLMQSIQHHDHCRLDSRTAARGIGGGSHDDDDACSAARSPTDEDDVIKAEGEAEAQMFQFDLDDQEDSTEEHTDMNGGLVSPADQDSDTEIKVASTPSAATTPSAGDNSNKSKQQQQTNISSSQQHKIANNKLLALLSKLDTSRGDYGYSRQKRAMREMSRNRAQDILPCTMTIPDFSADHQSEPAATTNGKIAAASMPATSYLVVSRKQKQPGMNFKFLSKGNNTQHNITCNETAPAAVAASSPSGGLKRCESAPVLGEATDITFTVSNVVDNSDESDPDDVAIEVVAAGSTDAVDAAATDDKALTDQIKKGLEGEVAAAVAEAAEEEAVEDGKASEEGQQKQQQSDNGNKYRRCSSLKSGKTPPGSPGKRKIVRFADLFGLDLSEIKTICDDIPKVPKSAFQDLKNAELSGLDSDSGTDTSAPYRHNSACASAATAAPRATPRSTPSRLQPLFTQPSGTPAMLNNLRDRKVSLESAYVDQAARLIKGIVRVVNFDFHKAVSVRYTTDDWATHKDATAAYLSGTADGFSDRFSFVVDASGVFDKVGGRIQMCVNFRCLGNEYWDSNNGGNYVFQYFAGYQPSSRPLAASPSDSRQQQQSHTFSQLSNSPTTFSDDPWLRYM